MSAFESESRCRRGETIAVFQECCASWDLERAEFDVEGAVFAPAVEFQMSDGALALVSAHADGVSVLLGVDAELHDLADVAFEEALAEAVRLVQTEYIERIGPR